MASKSEEPGPEAYGPCTVCSCSKYVPEDDYVRGPCVNTRSDGNKCNHSFGNHDWQLDGDKA